MVNSLTMVLIIATFLFFIFWHRSTIWAHIKWVLTSEYVWLIAADLCILSSSLDFGPELDDDPETAFLIFVLLFCNVFVGTHVLVYISGNLFISMLRHVRKLYKVFKCRFF